MAVAPVNQIGATFSLVAGVPATYDEAGYEALSFVELDGVVSLPELGDTTEQISVNALATGRTAYANGVKNFPPFVIPYIFSKTDAGQILARAGANTNTLYSIQIEDNDGERMWITGYLANLMDTARDVTTYRGQSVEFRPTTGPKFGTA